MTTGERHTDYEALAQDALRRTVRAVLIHVARSGLPGEHHFYIAFNTNAPGVGISPRLKQKYPQEMTIVLQHRFWDLIVNEERFEVKLTFDGIPERLVVPFAAIKVFFDPSVPYGLQFEGSDLASGGGVELDAEGALDVAPRFGATRARKSEAAPEQAPAGRTEKKQRPPRKPRTKVQSQEAEEMAARPRALPAPSGDSPANRQGMKPKLVASAPERSDPPAND